MSVLPLGAFSDNYIWVIIDKKTSMFDCIDPGDAKPVLAFAQANKFTLRTILLTHHHSDHIGGVGNLIKNYPKCLVIGPNDTRIPYKNFLAQENHTIPVGRYNFTVLFNPGHTATHISYYEPQQAWLFCGDTLFSAGCGRVFDGTIEQLHSSLLLFKNLPSTTKIFCAHEYTIQNLQFAQSVEPLNEDIIHHLAKLKSQNNACSLPSTLALELRINPFLRTDVQAVQEYALKHGATCTTSLEVFKTLRRQKNNFF